MCASARITDETRCGLPTGCCMCWMMRSEFASTERSYPLHGNRSPHFAWRLFHRHAWHRPVGVAQIDRQYRRLSAWRAAAQPGCGRAFRGGVRHVRLAAARTAGRGICGGAQRQLDRHRPVCWRTAKLHHRRPASARAHRANRRLHYDPAVLRESLRGPQPCSASHRRGRHHPVLHPLHLGRNRRRRQALRKRVRRRLYDGTLGHRRRRGCLHFVRWLPRGERDRFRAGLHHVRRACIAPGRRVLESGVGVHRCARGGQARCIQHHGRPDRNCSHLVSSLGARLFRAAAHHRPVHGGALGP